jgi:prepilin-type N-terminal cleavage/methylation domain-containing protein
MALSLKPQSGFTLIEVIVTVSIIAIASSAATFDWIVFARNRQAQEEAESLGAFVRNAREAARAGMDSSGAGIYFPPDGMSYVFYQGPDYSSRNAGSDILVESLTGSITNNFPGGVLSFEKGSGLPSASGTIGVSKGTSRFVLDINAQGAITTANE